LFIASQYGHVAVVEALARLKADVNAADSHGQTPLRIATCQRHDAAVRALKAAGAL